MASAGCASSVCACRRTSKKTNPKYPADAMTITATSAAAKTMRFRSTCRCGVPATGVSPVESTIRLPAEGSAADRSNPALSIAADPGTARHPQYSRHVFLTGVAPPGPSSRPDARNVRARTCERTSRRANQRPRNTRRRQSNGHSSRAGGDRARRRRTRRHHDRQGPRPEASGYAPERFRQIPRNQP